MNVDAATRELYDAVRASPRHAPFIERVDRSPRRPRTVRPGTLIAIAPAALYREYRGSGADGRRIREAAEHLAVPVETIPLLPTGSLRDNAAILVDWLRTTPYSNVVIVSLSKGSSDVKKALADASAAEAFRRVSVWISIGGLLEGTPLARWLLSEQRFPKFFRAVNRLRNVDLKFVEEVDRRTGGPLDFEFVVPPHMTLMHLLGFPLAEHTTNWLSRTLYRRLAEHGPNDGFMLLGDALRWPGLIYPMWGADHYFRTRADPQALLERLLTTAVEEGNLVEAAGAEPVRRQWSSVNAENHFFPIPARSHQ